MILVSRSTILTIPSYVIDNFFVFYGFSCIIRNSFIIQSFDLGSYHQLRLLCPHLHSRLPLNPILAEVVCSEASSAAYPISDGIILIFILA